MSYDKYVCRMSRKTSKVPTDKKKTEEVVKPQPKRQPVLSNYQKFQQDCKGYSDSFLY